MGNGDGNPKSDPTATPVKKSPLSILDLMDISSPAIVPTAPDPLTRGEMDEWDKIEKGLRNKDFFENIKARRRTSRCLFWMVAAWLAMDILIILLEGFGGYKSHAFHLDSNVLITLITSTTAGVLGLFGIVTRYLFPPPHKH
ncbi:MAG: hypothetical protein ABIW76_13965 [Fibrobacteria bacterium]